MKKCLVAAIAAGLVAAVSAAPAAARTVPIVTGGATNLIPGLNVTVNGLFETTTGDFKGKINYDFATTGEHFLFRVECVGVDPATNTAVAVGPERDNPNMWAIAWVQDNEDAGTADQVSVVFHNEGVALANCQNPQDLAAVPVTDGNFQVRPFPQP